MACKPEDNRPEDTELANTPADAPVLDRVQELTWAAIDDVASDDDFRLLETLLLSGDEAVDNYLGCVQLHVDLLDHFGAGTNNAAILANLPHAAS
jgi:hypothetical protein